MTTCPRCGSPEVEEQTNYAKETGRTWWVCGTYQTRDCHPHHSELCLEREEKLQTMRDRDEARECESAMNQCNDPDHASINAERGESTCLRKAWVALDDKRQDLEQQLTAALRERDEARNLADAAMWEADRLRCKLWRAEQEGDSTHTPSKRSYWPVKNAQSSKSDTPETDMLLSDQQHDCVPYDDAAEQLADLAQKLERERDEAREALK